MYYILIPLYVRSWGGGQWASVREQKQEGCNTQRERNPEPLKARVSGRGR